MGHVTGPCGECVHQFEMFAMLQYVDKLVKLVIKPRIFSPVARQPALTKIVVGGLKCYHPSMKRIRSPSTELWHILAIYNLCPCDLDFWPIFSKIGSCDQDPCTPALYAAAALLWHIQSGRTAIGRGPSPCLRSLTCGQTAVRSVLVCRLMVFTT